MQQQRLIIQSYFRIALSCAICGLAAPAMADDAKNEDLGFVLEDQAFTPSASGPVSASNPLNIHGFASVGIVKASQDTEHRFGFTEKMDYSADSVLALRMSYALNKKSKFVIQLIAQGKQFFDVSADWAYLDYQWSDNFKSKFGRIRSPLYYLSESVDVGFSYPFIRPPLEVYAAGDNSIEGFDLTYDFDLFTSASTLQFFTGDTDGEVDNPVYADTPRYTGYLNVRRSTIDDEWGLNLISHKNNLTTRLGYLTFDAKTDFTIPLGGLVLFDSISQRSEYYSAAVVFDNATWYFITEMGQFNAIEKTLAPDNEVGYVCLGYHVEKWQPYIIYGARNPTDTLSATQIPQHGKSVSLGTKYELDFNMSVKFEINHYFEFKGSEGTLGGNYTNGAVPQKDSTTIVGLVIDVVF